MAMIIVAAAMAETRWQSMGMTRFRLLVLPVQVNVVYFALGAVVARLGLGNCDAGLLRADRSLFGETPAVLCSDWIHPFFTDVLSGCYLSFLPAVLVVFLVILLRPVAAGLGLFDGLFGVYAIGFLGYTLVPAAGPHLPMPEAFPIALEGGFLTGVNAAAIGSGSNHVDVFPSLHTAVTVFLMGWLWPRRRRLFLALLLPASGIIISTIYLRYHYAVDVAAGLCLAAVGLWLSSLTNKKHEPDTRLQ
jgi:membrane-associated phospholipid phosphatase